MSSTRTFIPLPLVKKGGQFRGSGDTVNHDPVLNRAMAKAYYWQSLSTAVRPVAVLRSPRLKELIHQWLMRFCDLRS